MRIIAGRFRGHHLFSPDGDSVRPTTDRVREAVFSILGGRCDEACVLDLYCGTGALGLESISRGAASVMFVDKSRKSLALAQKNAGLLGVEASFLLADLPGQLGRVKPARAFDLVFMDPPYHRELLPPTIAGLLERALLAPGAVIVAEHEPKFTFGALAGGRLAVDTRNYGDSHVSLLTLQAEGAGE